MKVFHSTPNADFFKDKSTPTCVQGMAGHHTVDVSCGSAHTVCITASGNAYSWGNNAYHQLGIGDIEAKGDNVKGAIAVPTRIPKLVGIKLIGVSCGAGHTVVVCDKGRVFAWGINQQGQLGIGLDERGQIIGNVSEPQLVRWSEDGVVVTSLACGIAHTVFLHLNGSISACGMNNYGQLGLGEKVQDLQGAVSSPSGGFNMHIPTIVTISTREPVSEGNIVISHIACGGAHTLVVDVSGYLYSSGSNSCGQLGHGSHSDYSYFQQIDIRKFSSAGESTTRIAFCACGEEYSAAVSRGEGNVFTWGLGIVGQLGNGQLSNQDTPTEVTAMTRKGVEVIACSQGQVFAVTRTGEVLVITMLTPHLTLNAQSILTCSCGLGDYLATGCLLHRSWVLMGPTI